MDYNFPVKREKVFCDDGTYVGKEAIRNATSGAILGVVSETYHLLEHKDAVKSAEEVLNDIGKWEQKKITLTGDGARMRVEYDFPEMEINLGKTKDVHGTEIDDIVNPRLILMNSYDESLEFGFMLGAWRLVCTNGLRVGTDIFQIRRRHTSGLNLSDIRDKARDASNMFFSHIVPKYKDMVQDKIADIGGFLEGMVERKKLPVRLVQKVVDRIVVGASLPVPVVIEGEGKKNKFEAVKNVQKTKWDLYNEFTWHLTHEYDKSDDRRETLGKVVAKAFGL